MPKDYPELIEDDIDIYLCNFVYLIISKKEKEYIKEVSAYKKHDDHWDSYPVLKINLGTKDNSNEKNILYDRKNGFRNMTLEDMKKEGYEIENKKFIVEKKILEKYGLSIEDAKIEAKYERLELELR